MAETSPVTQIRTGPLEVTIRASEAGDIGFTPRELRMIYEKTGRPWSQIMADEKGDDSDRWRSTAWLRLRREGHPVEWEEMDDVVIRIVADVDPTSGGQPSTSPTSASSGA